jgi:hypothetical protein
MDNATNPRQRNFVIGLIIIGLMIIVFFGFRTARAFRQFNGHRPPPSFVTKAVETDVNLIRDWMTVPFISKMYRIPPPVLFDALEIPEHGNQEKSLKQLNEEYYLEAEGIVLERVKAATLAALASQPQPVQNPSNTPVVP